MTQIRKSARRVADVPADVLASLHLGELQTTSLVEWLAIDQTVLAASVLPGLGLAKLVAPVQAAVRSLSKPTAGAAGRAIGVELARAVSVKAAKTSHFQKLIRHGSDSVRCWAAFVVAGDPSLDLALRLEAMKPLAADPHFGVREIAWLALRPQLVEQIDEAIALLSPWTNEADPNLRRFASEATRPCGVWAKHCDRLKQKPELGLPVLEPLRADQSKYVRDSVANWLNDASKTAPEWVRDVCRRWERESPTDATRAIVVRALRTLRKQG